MSGGTQRKPCGIDRVEHPATPECCRHWPESYEQSGDFDWAAEFNF